MISLGPRHQRPRRTYPFAAAGTESAQDRPRFRPDVEGLRAVAVLLVLAYHAGLPLVSGGFVGVDVFFVISGFLITGLILREVESTGRLRLGRFYARRIRRLLPATAVVLAATAALTIVLLPPLRWPAIAGDIAVSATYVVNWRLASESVDYLTAEDAPSPVQHFWSLAVEEQFYLLWPVLIIALVWWHRRRRGAPSLRRTLLAGLAVVAVPSLAWSVHLTAASPGAAYFVSTTRAWELAAGAALAIGARRLERLPAWVASALAGGGLAAVGWAALTYDATTPFPGAAALVPVLGTAAVVGGGVASAPTSPGADREVPGSGESHKGNGTLPGRLLGTAPLRWVGG
ncbi:acyltransferase, partial [Jiangella aurantiaca]